jgi:hypothetical protein
MNRVQKSIAMLRLEGALVFLAAAALVVTGATISLLAKFNVINPRLDSLLPFFMLLGLIAISHAHLAIRVSRLAEQLSGGSDANRG